MKKVDLLICDDHQIFIDGLRAGLLHFPDINIIGQALTGEETLRLAKGSMGPDVLLLDVEFPDLKGPAISRQLKSTHPALKILGLTMHESSRVVREMTAAGADGYLLKNATIEEIVAAIRAVNAGEKYFKGVVLSKIIEFSHTPPTDKLADLLTNRELQILKLLGKGKSSKEVANDLFISIHTVNSHRKNMLKKLNLRSTAELVSFAFTNGLIHPGQLPPNS